MDLVEHSDRKCDQDGRSARAKGGWMEGFRESTSDMADLRLFRRLKYEHARAVEIEAGEAY